MFNKTPKEKAIVVMQLPVSTGECDIGPQLSLDLGKMEDSILKYDHENKWITIRLKDVIGVKTITDISTTLFHVEAYSSVCIIENSKWLHELKEKARNRRHNIPETYSHFMIYFDHFCAIEFIAVGFELVEPIQTFDEI